jgi:hypothetical protein
LSCANQEALGQFWFALSVSLDRVSQQSICFFPQSFVVAHASAGSVRASLPSFCPQSRGIPQ